MLGPYEYKVTGFLLSGKRLRPIRTIDYKYASGIELSRGSIWSREVGHTEWELLKRVVVKKESAK